ncbi:hypothetical protein ACFYOT_41685 [Saccharothrix saharensis]|uniref:hypothetical protein n=1 Tax=Saccharothrix saharensis TaxID=571190 RepID=UPI003690E218
MGNRIVPSLVFGGPEPGAFPPDPHPTGPVSGSGGPDGDGRFLRRRELDLRRTEAPGPGALPVLRAPHPRRHAIRTFDEKGRIGDRLLFGVLEWHSRMQVSIRVHNSGALVVCRDPKGGSALTERTMVAVPMSTLRWCGFVRREQVLLVAVPSLSALVIHGQETLDRLLPDPERVVTEARSAGEGSAVSRTSSSGAPGGVGADRGVGPVDG